MVGTTECFGGSRFGACGGCKLKHPGLGFGLLTCQEGGTYTDRASISLVGLKRPIKGFLPTNGWTYKMTYTYLSSTIVVNIYTDIGKH